MNEFNPYDSPATRQSRQGRGISRELSFMWWFGLLSPFVLLVLDLAGAIPRDWANSLLGIEPFVGVNAFGCGLLVMLIATTNGHDRVGQRILSGLASAAVMLTCILTFYMLIFIIAFTTGNV